MLDHDTRVSILRLARQGHAVRTIARALGVSRDAVRTVIESNRAEVPEMRRCSRLEPHLERIRELHQQVGGNLVRVREKLAETGLVVPYSTLTDFCRQAGMSAPAKKAAGQYEFAPGEEMQHDTSPHAVKVGAIRCLLHCAALVLCYSRMIFAQAYPTWNRFWARVFLREALIYFGGAARRAMIDNSSVILSRKSGTNAVVAPEMQEFARHYGFVFEAHAVGDANRSARVERPFGYIERNFYPGREFADLADLNIQMQQWCGRASERYMRHLRARPIDLFVVEKAALVPLPIHIPEVYQLHHRTVDTQGYVSVHTNRYEVPEELISKPVEVRESKDQVRIFRGPRLVIAYERHQEKSYAQVRLPEPRPTRKRTAHATTRESSEEKALRTAAAELSAMIDALVERHGGRATRSIKRLYGLFLDYPLAPLRAAVAEALQYGLLDIERLERMVLRRVGEEVFRIGLPPTADGAPAHSEDSEEEELDDER